MYGGASIPVNFKLNKRETMKINLNEYTENWARDTTFTDARIPPAGDPLFKSDVQLILTDPRAPSFIDSKASIRSGGIIRISPGVNIEAYAIIYGNTSFMPNSSVGEFTTVGEHVHIGSRAKVDNDVILGNHVFVDADAIIERGAYVGTSSSIYSRSIVGPGVELGRGSVVHAEMTHLVDIGVVDGYRKVFGQIGGVAYISSGCRKFTLAEAIEHWIDHMEDRQHTMCLMKAAIALANLRGLKHDIERE